MGAAIFYTGWLYRTPCSGEVRAFGCLLEELLTALR
jgi:hypothetical protein